MSTREPGRTPSPPDARPIRAAEVVASLSLATDLGMGQPLEHALRTAVIAVRLAGLAGVGGQEVADTYYAALLHSAGCTSDGHEQAELFGDDIGPRAEFALVDPGDPAQVLAFLEATVGGGRAPEVRRAMLDQAIENALPLARQTFGTHCEVAALLAGWLGLPTGVSRSLEHVFERWDGAGFPGAARGEAIPVPARLVHVARDVSFFLTAGGRKAARAMLEERAGAAYEERLAVLAADRLDEILDAVDRTRLWEQVLDLEPAPRRVLGDDEADDAFRAIAAFVDLKSPWLRGHSTGVAELAEAAAWREGLPAEAVTQLRRAALAHDLGRVGVSNAVWEKPGALGFGDWERVRLHPHLTERVLSRSEALAPIGALAGAHHERLDGSGYHRGSGGAALDRAARILAAADCYQAMREDRPHRRALDGASAHAAVMREADEGRLCGDAADAVCAAAGHPVAPRPRELPAGLTPRELEVLRVLARGRSNREIADELGVSAKTVGHHVEHVYRKAGVRSRAAATLWAFENDLLPGA